VLPRVYDAFGQARMVRYLPAYHSRFDELRPSADNGYDFPHSLHQRQVRLRHGT
jgi:hypothetical protein